MTFFDLMQKFTTIQANAPKSKPNNKSKSTPKNHCKAVILGAVLATAVPFFAPDAAASNTLSGALFESKAHKFLPVNQAFSVSAAQQGDKIVVQFVITPEHYAYKDKLKLKLPDGISASDFKFDKSPTMVDDPDFGRVAVFEQNVTATAMLANTSTTAFAGEVAVSWQGCAKAGLCYPPQTVKTAVNLPAGKSDKPHTKPNDNSAADNASSQMQNPVPNPASKSAVNAGNVSDGKKAAPVQNASNPVATAVQNTPTDAKGAPLIVELADGQTLAAAPMEERAQALDMTQNSAMLQEELNKGATASAVQIATDEVAQSPVKFAGISDFGLTTNPMLAVFALFLLGIGLAFTACVYPMIPIVANIVARSHNPTMLRGFLLTGAYGLGVATSYGILGAVIAWLGRAVGLLGYLQNPWVLGTFAAIFVLLALQMFGVLRVGLPSKIKDKLASNSQKADRYLGSIGGSFVVGALSALVVSPCVSAPLAGALAGVSAVGSVPLGFVALFALGLGLSLPLVVIGTTQGTFMPKAGAWMDSVKYFGGIMLLFVAILLLNRISLSPFMLLLWAAWFALAAIFLWRLRLLGLQMIAAVLGLWAAALTFGAAMGETDALTPLKKIGTTTTIAAASAHQDNAPNNRNRLADQKITTLAELETIVAKHDKTLVEITADWCIECRIMEKTLFTDRPVVMNDWQFVKLDITETTDDSNAILAHYNVFGPPVLLYYQNGALQQMQVGEVARAEFETALAAFD